MVQVTKAQPSAPLWRILAKAADLLATDPARAEYQARALLRTVPAQPHTLLLLVSAKRSQGDIAGARALLEQMAAQRPNLAAIHNELGLLLAELGEVGAARRAFSRVVELEPEHPTAWRALGDQLSAAGDIPGAKGAYARHFRSAVMDVLMLEQVMALDPGQIEIADAMLREFLTIYPTDVTATRMLGQMYMRANQCAAAERMFARVLELAPGSTAARRDFAAALSVTLTSAAQQLDLDPLQAIAQAMDILAELPGQQQALMLLVNAYRLSGNPAGAREALESMAAAQPDLAAIRHELGVLLGTLGQHEYAERHLSHAVSQEPNHPAAWRLLANELAQSGDTEGAARAYGRHLAVSLKELKLLEETAEKEGETAENMLRQSLAINPTDIMTIRMLSRKEFWNGRFREAGVLLEDALRLAPDLVEMRRDYAIALHKELRWQDANDQLDIAIKSRPEDVMLQSLKASNFVLMGEFDRALALFDAIRQRAGKQAEYWLNYGHALRTTGRSREAVEAFRKCAAIDPTSGLAWWSLADLKTYRFSSGERAIMRAQLQRDDLKNESACYLEFSLGRALEDRHAFAESFEHYRRGNALRRSGVRYDPDSLKVRIAKSKALFTFGFFRAREGFGSSSPDPIFIVGMPRSGSTLIEQILSSHSAVEGTAELPDLSNIVLELNTLREGVNYPDVLAVLDAATQRRFGERYLELTRPQRRLGRPFFTDKDLRNFQHVGLIQLILPHAKIIDARRDPMACCFSGYKQCFALGSMPHTYDLSEIGRYYREYVELMDLFDAVLPGRVHRVFHENLVRDPESEIRPLLVYCNLPFEKSCLRFHETERGVRTSSSEQVRRPISAPAIEPWRNYEAWLGPLKEALGDMVDRYPADLELAGQKR
jgi:predicted Zn-dependent protease